MWQVSQNGVFSIFHWYSNCLHGSMKCNNFHLKILSLFSLRWWNVNLSISLIQIVFPSFCLHFMKPDTPLCDTCHIIDDYEHYFISCKSLDSFWNDVKILLEKLRIGIHILSYVNLSISLIQIVFPSFCLHFMKPVGCSLIFLFIMFGVLYISCELQSCSFFLELSFI
jgi:hypothetical protein